MLLRRSLMVADGGLSGFGGVLSPEPSITSCASMKSAAESAAKAAKNVCPGAAKTFSDLATYAGTKQAQGVCDRKAIAAGMELWRQGNTACDGEKAARAAAAAAKPAPAPVKPTSSSSTLPPAHLAPSSGSNTTLIAAAAGLVIAGFFLLKRKGRR